MAGDDNAVFARASRGGDLERIVSFWSDGAIVYPPGAANPGRQMSDSELRRRPPPDTGLQCLVGADRRCRTSWNHRALEAVVSPVLTVVGTWSPYDPSQIPTKSRLSSYKEHP